MTGFGKAEVSVAGVKITDETRSLNGKQLDLSVKMPSRYRPFDPKDIENIHTFTITFSPFVKSSINIALKASINIRDLSPRSTYFTGTFDKNIAITRNTVAMAYPAAVSATKRLTIYTSVVSSLTLGSSLWITDSA